MKEVYFKFVNFIQEMPGLWFATIWLGILALAFVLMVKFYKIYNGTQKSFEKISLLVLTLILIAILVYLTYVRI